MKYADLRKRVTELEGAARDLAAAERAHKTAWSVRHEPGSAGPGAVIEAGDALTAAQEHLFALVGEGES